MELESLYRTYSHHLKTKYGQKVYKLPVNIPCSCPNRDGTKGKNGCIFCGESGSGFELLDQKLSVTEQLNQNKAFIQKKYKANSFIAYYQSFSNTYLNFDLFKKFMLEGASFPDVVELSISTRPDCIQDHQLDYLSELKNKYNTNITLELGLQSANNKTLSILNRGHTLEDYIHSANRIHEYGFNLTTHVISDLPWDTEEDIFNLSQVLNETESDYLKIHSLYVEKNTELEKMYINGLKLLDADQYINRTIMLLENIHPEMVIQRLIGRVPESESVIANWHQSWWKIRDQLVERMIESNSFQGKYYGR